MLYPSVCGCVWVGVCLSVEKEKNKNGVIFMTRYQFSRLYILNKYIYQNQKDYYKIKIQFSFDSDNYIFLQLRTLHYLVIRYYKSNHTKLNASKYVFQSMRKPTLLALKTYLCQMPHLEGFTILFGTHFKIQSFSNCTTKNRKLSSYKINLQRKIYLKFNIKSDLYGDNSKTHGKKQAFVQFHASHLISS